MKIFATISLLLWAYISQAQDSTYKLHALGIDIFKNFPFRLLYPQEKKTSPTTISYFSHPRILELHGQLTTPKRGALLNVAVGYAAIEHFYQQRLTQYIEGYYLKVGREFQGQYHKNTRGFWGYNLTLTRTKVTGQIEIPGQYFKSFTTPIPDDDGFGMGADITVGMSYVLFRRIETRFSARSALVLSDIGSPNAVYLPGVGIRASNRPLSFSGGMTIQLFYLIKRVPKRISSN